MGFEQDNLDYYDKFDKIFKYYVLNNDILGATVLSTGGEVMYNSLTQEILLRALKELEFRFMKGVKDYPLTINILNNEQKVFSEMISIQNDTMDCIIILLFGSSISLGIAVQNLKKITTRIKNAL